MPGRAFHLVVASRVGQRLGGALSGGAEPWLLAGSLGPDMGYSPGGWRLLADLGHYVSSGRLVRSLNESAEDERQRAFVAGWASHVMADVHVHPEVNRAAAEVFCRPGHAPISFADDPAAHAWVEVLLDAAIQARHPEARELIVPEAWPDVSPAWIERAVERCYGRSCPPEVVRRTVDASRRFGARLVRLNRVVAAPSGVVSRVARAGLLTAMAAVVLVKRPSLIRRPAAWSRAEPELLAAAEAAVDGIAAATVELVDDGFRSLADFNLDLGVVEERLGSYGPTRRALDGLERLEPVSEGVAAPTGGAE